LPIFCANYAGDPHCGTFPQNNIAMKVSLAIATIGRIKELNRLLDSLRRQTHTDFEVLIADQNPLGFLDDILNTFACDLHIQRVCIEPQGVSNARNALFKLLAGDLVAFPDDDCWYAPDTLETVAKFFQQHESAQSAVGIWLHDESALPNPDIYNFSTHVVNYRELFRRGETYVQFFRKGAVKAIGMFDPILGPGTGLPYGCGEDTDYLLRATKVGQVWRVPTIRVFHPLPNTQNPNQAHKWRAYGRGRMYLLKKHKLPLWFKIGNVAYPLWRALIEGRGNWRYRWEMFRGRLTELMNR